MKIKDITPKAFVITAPRLDPVTVILNDVDPGRGQLILECFGCAWSAWWGAMGDGYDLRRFLLSVSVGYVTNCLIRGRRQFATNQRALAREEAYLAMIVGALREELREVQP